MEKFVSANPEVVMWVCGLLLSFIGILITAIIFFVKQYLDDTSATIKSFDNALEIIKEDLGIIKDRMQRQETICEMQRKFCPNWKAVSMALTGGHSECPADCVREGGV